MICFLVEDLLKGHNSIYGMTKDSAKTLKIVLDDITAPFFILWKWKKKDYEQAVRLNIEGVWVDYYFVLNTFSSEAPKQRDREFMADSRIVISIKEPPQDLLDGLKNPQGANGKVAAEKIYTLYKKTIDKLILYSRWELKLPNLMNSLDMASDKMFYDDVSLTATKSHVWWKLNGEEKFKQFLLKPKKRGRRINPIFKGKNLLSTEKWRRLNKFTSSNPYIGKELEELTRIKADIAWEKKRIPAIETAALMEVVIRNKVQVVVEKKGQSKTKIDNINDDIGYSVLLNMFLPLILSKAEVVRYKRYIDALDNLRKVRNDIMHRNISEEKIDRAVIEEGVGAAIKITLLLNKKM